MSGVQEFFSIVPWTIIFQFCNLLILCLLIKKFLFQRVMLVLGQRQKEVDDIYAAANEDRGRAAELKQNYDLRMAGAREEADQQFYMRDSDRCGCLRGVERRELER